MTLLKSDSFISEYSFTRSKKVNIVQIFKEDFMNFFVLAIVIFFNVIIPNYELV